MDILLFRKNRHFEILFKGLVEVSIVYKGFGRVLRASPHIPVLSACKLLL